MREVVAIENPLSEELSIMRPTLLGSLLDAARHNLAHGAREIAIFESGTVYRVRRRDRRGAREHQALGVLLSGALTPRSWRGERTEADFFAAKALLEGCWSGLHVGWRCGAEPGRWPFLHPGAARVGARRRRDARFPGELHPLVAAAWDLPRGAAFAIDLGKLAAAAPEAVLFAPFGAFPALRQDIAVTLPEDVSAERCSTLCAPPPASDARATRACSTSTAASRWGRGGARWRSR